MISEISLRTAIELYGVVERAIVSHKEVGRGLQRVFKRREVPSRKRGNLCFKAFLEDGLYLPGKREEVEELSQYWDKNYDEIVKQFFYDGGSTGFVLRVA